MKPIELACQFAELKKSLECGEWAMRFLGLKTYGIESVSVENRSMTYVNTGDTYSDTIVREGSIFFVDSWGDWFEQAEQDHCDETDSYCCGYCSHYTPRGAGFHETSCEHCGNLVAG